jgi:hypothetical protein
MALHRIDVDLFHRLPTVGPKPSRKKSRPKLLWDPTPIGSRHEIKDEDLQRFKRDYGLWF